MTRLAWLIFVFFTLSLTLAQAPLPSGWQEVKGPEGTMCSDGSAWKFFVSQGDNKKLVLDFQGGGACWSEGTCDPKAETFTRTLGVSELYLAQGIYNRVSVANPFFGWTHVFVPYCTGDVHWGNTAAKYGNLTVQHKGAVNAGAALDWAFKNIPAPEQVVVTGCSAGAYGATLWSAYAMKQYPNAKVTQLGDAGVGVVHEAFTKTGFPNWNPVGAIPDFIPELAALKQDISKLNQTQLYRAIARAYPKNVMSQYTTAQDAVQIGFYGIMKGEVPPKISQPTALEWIQGAQASLASIKQTSPNFFSYVAPGGQHCVIPRPELYTLKVGETTLLDWINKLVKTGNPGDVAPR